MEKHVVIELFSADVTTELKLNFAEGGIFAGFPSPAQDYMELSIDLNTELIKHPASTFFGRVRGNSLCDAGVEEGDILVIDKSLQPSDGDMVVAFIDGEFTLKFIHFESDNPAPDKIWLMPANDTYQPIMVTPDNEFLVWGVVTYTIKKRK
ncbi:LexA family protein [Culturomica massiliensis]|uniref:LexA family protein n=1 Tax=Culturomica massiliensis TaxID=1841857 RepID=UPI0026651B34|nr:translesion error-prone DNA polymerase V autoproteolytic subunit [Culturomica massiliensis]